MKRSLKILYASLLVLFMFFLVGVLILKNEARRVVANYSTEMGLKQLDVGSFRHIVFDSGWEVTVDGIMGTSISIQDLPGIHTKVRNVNDTVYFELAMDSTYSKRIKAHIRKPYLRSITIAHGTSVELDEFESDSLSVILEDNLSFSGVNCNIDHFFLKTKDGIELNLSKGE